MKELTLQSSQSGLGFGTRVIHSFAISGVVICDEGWVGEVAEGVSVVADDNDGVEAGGVCDVCGITGDGLVAVSFADCFLLRVGRFLVSAVLVLLTKV